MKVLVVDDEPLARERMLRLLKRVSPDAELLEAGSGVRAVALAREEQPELILLDIRMPGMDGIAVASALQDMEQPPAIVFCTAYDHYALEALQQQAVAYLLKPVREEHLRSAIERARRVNLLQLASLGGVDGVRTHITSETHRGMELVPLDEVRCFIAEQKYVRVCAPGVNLLIPDTLKELEQEFASQVVRIHRNALVALKYITRLRKDASEGWCVELEGMDVSPQVSRRHLVIVKERLRR